MKLDVFPLEGYIYQGSVKSIPVVVRLSSIEIIEIAEKIDLREIVLLQGDDPVFGGYIRSGLGWEKDTITISPDKPHHKMYDICNYEDSDLLPGKYDVNIALQVYRYEHGKRAETVDLQAKCELLIN
ncbi:hypothetical protein EJP82_27760 [Paenibacillus anaericanus]|uniref:Uncharacterized protein n=1 Tax=Paenibacillus anaericanus TaxID=170367 RepID=A0A433XTS7_9BACL|nr:hypothetical protein [Paenibacillus anaericanus]RUT37757.1 hypothetical protein EJP82_27760 [Paenibacillus anaericanus]